MSNNWLEKASVQEPNALTMGKTWYERFRERLSALRDLDRFVPCTTAWALQVESGRDEIASMQDVLAFEDGRSSTSLVPDAARILEGSPPELLPGEWVYDVVDAILGKNTRTVMGDDPRGGPPIPIDKWAYRDVGFIDPEIKSWALKHGSAAANQLVVDDFNEDTYNYAHDFYVTLTNELNTKHWKGEQWLPHQVVAVGRITMQKVMGTKPIFPEDIIPDP